MKNTQKPFTNYAGAVVHVEYVGPTWCVKRAESFYLVQRWNGTEWEDVARTGSRQEARNAIREAATS